MKLVFIDDAKSGMIVARDVVAPDIGANALVRRGTTLTFPLIQRMGEYGVSSLYIKESEEDGLSDSPRSSGLEIPFSVPKPKPVISTQLRDEAVQSLKEMYFAVSISSQDVHASSRIIKHLDRVVEQLIDSLTSDNSALINIGDLKSYDEYTYHHSLSVAVLSIAVAQYYGLDKKELARLAKSAIMHDIGKTAVPIEIIHKTSRLEDWEFAIVKTHSRAGYDYMSGALIGDEDIRSSVLCHHEKFDGTGYPKGLKGGEIPLWSRIISVADVYDALTSDRPYRQPMQPSDALEYIMGGVGSFFDFDVVEALTKKLEPYPVGSLVELSDKRVAVVMHNQYPIRPVVKLVKTGEILDLFHERKLLNVVINRMLRDDLPSRDEIIIT